MKTTKLRFAAAFAAMTGPFSDIEWVHRQQPSENPWGPPSAKPEHLRDAEDLRKLQRAQERRERKAKR